jgi:hypothetical protein
MKPFLLERGMPNVLEDIRHVIKLLSHEPSPLEGSAPPAAEGGVGKVLNKHSSCESMRIEMRKRYTPIVA